MRVFLGAKSWRKEVSPMKSILGLAIVVFTGSSIFAQGFHDRPDTRPVVLLPGLGHHQHPISTANHEAQKFFDQGLVLVYGFNREEAIRSFKQAAELDPQSPMPYWGIALAYGYHLNMDMDKDVHSGTAFEAIQKAVALSQHAPQYERDYVAALARRCSGDPHADGSKLAMDYKNAMAQLVARYPDDTDGATLYAESWMDLDRYDWYEAAGQPKPGTDEILLLLESVLRREPDHPGANHLYVHVLDTSPHPERALASAYRLMQIAPGAGHLVHMAGHIFWSFGDYQMAANVNERAAEADRNYVQLTGVDNSVYSEGYYAHNVHFIARSYTELGRFEEAKKAADLLAQHVLPAYVDMPGMVDGYLPNPFLVLLRFQRWEDVLHYPKPDPRMGMSIALWHYAKAVALVAKGDRKAALDEQEGFEKSRPAVRATTEFFSNAPGKIIEVAAAVLAARLATDTSKSISLWEKAVALQDALDYDEPPPWDYPVRESLGSALLRGGRTAEAEAVFREDLRRNPRNPRALFGLWQSLASQHKTVDAGWVQRQFEEAWKNADFKLRLEDF
jgi:tetratricopeptide (TPR) repeat protein